MKSDNALWYDYEEESAPRRPAGWLMRAAAGLALFGAACALYLLLLPG